MANTNINHAAEVAEAITSGFYNNGFDLSHRERPPGDPWSEMLEVKSAMSLRKCGVPDRDVRLFLTFIAAMDYNRASEPLWDKGLELFRSNSKLFDPAEVATIKIDTLQDMLRESKVSQKHERDASAWKTIACSLADAENPVSRVINDGEGDAIELLHYLGTESKGKPRFPHLIGPKIGPMWMRMLIAPGNAKIKNSDIIPVAVDTHVKSVTKNLCILDTQDSSETLEPARSAIQHVWRKAIEGAQIGKRHGLSGSALLDPALWFFGKWGCSHCKEKNRWMPISLECGHCQFPPRHD